MEDYYCPKCYHVLERLSSCGTVGYMCDTCKTLVSKSKILSYSQMKEESIREGLQDEPTQKF